MRKISILSLIAVLAATPMMAEAARDTTKVKVDNYSGPAQANTNVASTSYVQGAYKAASDRIDALVTDVTVAAAEAGKSYVAVTTTASVGENLAELDKAIAKLGSDTTADIDSAIKKLDSDVVSSAATDDVTVTINEVDGKLTSVSAVIKEGAVGSDEIATDAVGSDEIAANAVGSAEIAADAVIEAKIAQSAVTSAKINDGAVIEGKIAQSAVTSAKINDGAVIEDKIAQSAVTSAKIADGAVIAAKIAESAVTTTQIADGTITVTDINGDAMAAAVDSAYTGLTDLAQQGYVDEKDAATLSAAQNYTDSKRLTVYTSWTDATASQAIALN